MAPENGIVQKKKKKKKEEEEEVGEEEREGHSTLGKKRGRALPKAHTNGAGRGLGAAGSFRADGRLGTS
jgi:hypothetical protein